MRRFCRYLVLFIFLSSWLSIASAQVVNMPDANLAAMVREALGLAPNVPITQQALRGLGELDASHWARVRGQIGQIRNLTGLEYATQLTRLWLGGNQIRDLRPLAGLTKLYHLDIEDNQISDIRPLTGLTQLRRLSIIFNPIDSLLPLTRLTQLRDLFVTVQSVSDLRRHIDLTQLEGLGIWGGGIHINDLHLLSSLTQLKRLTVKGAQIRDIRFLESLTQLETLDLYDNQIRDVAPLSGLTQLTYLDLGENEISDLKPLSGLTQLTGLYLDNNQIHDVTPLTELVNLEWLYMEDNPIQDASPLANLPNLNDTDIDIPEPPPIKIPDPNLAAAVRKVLGLGQNARITKQKMRDLTELKAPNSEIRDLTGLEHATQLTRLDLQQNQIRDLRPLKDLKKLWRLDLWENQIRDISPLASLTNLTGLFLSSNQIQDIMPIAGLTELRGLGLGYNTPKIRDITSLSDLTKLDWLRLVGNQISDVSPLAGLVNLETLWLKGNPIQDASPLSSLTKLTGVDIEIPKQGVPATGTWLFISKPPNLTPDNFTIGPGEFVILVHQGKQNAVKKADFKTYASYYTVGDNADLPNLAQLFRNGGRIELLSHASLNPLPPDTKVPQFGDIVISEIMWGLNGASPAKQYIELYNASAHTYTFWEGNLSLRFSKASEAPLPDTVFPFSPNPNAHIKVVDRMSNKGWKVPGSSRHHGKQIPFVSMYRVINYKTGAVPDGTVARSWKASKGRVNLPAPSLGTPGAKHVSDGEAPVVHVKSPSRPPIYWVDTEKGTLHHLIGDEVEDLVPNTFQVTSLAIDTTTGKLYWTEKTGNKIGSIRRSNLNGSNVQLVKNLTSVPHGITIDATHGKLYLTNAWGKVQQLNLNGSSFQPNLITGLNSPKDIVVDRERDQLYWTESDSIWRADLNGSNREAFAPNLGELESITIAGGKIYSIERPGGEQHWQIRSSTLDGLTPPQTLVTLQSRPMGLAVDTAGGKLYWTTANGKIRRANLNGGDIQDVVTGLKAPADIVLGIPTRTSPAAPGNTSLVTRPLPAETLLLANYPNPFNPETWIPYQLATDTDAQILIYDARGSIVRRLVLGHQRAGTYIDRSRAAYWDGRNSLGEQVASGVYFYQLQADEISFMRKMLIVK